MNLFTKELLDKFEKYPLYSQDGKMGDAKVIAKFFNPIGNQTWLITEGNVIRDDSRKVVDVEMFGFANLIGLEYAELGYVYLSELQNAKLPYGFSIERDLHFPEDINLRDACKKEFGVIPPLFKEEIKYHIYQLKNIEENKNIRFLDYKDIIKKIDSSVTLDNYDCIYRGKITPQSNEFDINSEKQNNLVLENLFTRFNIDIPSDYKGHSLSVSDIIVLESNDISKAYYCDSFGFTEVDLFSFTDKESNLFIRLYNISQNIGDVAFETLSEARASIINPEECLSLADKLADYASELSIDLEERKSLGVSSVEMIDIRNQEQYISTIQILADDLWDYGESIEKRNDKEINDIELDK